MFKIYPAIDLRNGNCVQLQQGDPNRETVFSDNPVTMAHHWTAQGAAWLHLVDLDGAFSGAPQNADAIRRIVAAVEVPTQLGGGLRGMEQVRGAIDAGVHRPIIGTAAVESPELVKEAAAEFPDRIAVGIDARDGFVSTRGWKVTTELNAVEFAKKMEQYGATIIIFTDIGQDGMLKGPNVEATVALAEALTIPVIASGGVSTLDDVRRLAAVVDAGIDGVIIGSALYKHRFTLEEAIAAGS
ncbi:MAG: 1-(5-phosphoribosyl)-5-[(5-phosphoribosylamino)methylideneamino]imidazole-4-carboxamide isomerase [Candidatus Poribacteria bacterium]|nr:1-(5-phosphoribosyl)-5-[(5-phosphoribosylamino)methylideneamino]imidazole-4-carboxamide isomerase [Candidatus Poribacteria bacterium]